MKLKEPPLLSPPRTAPEWHGLPKELVGVLHRSMENNERDGQWHTFVRNAADLKMFGAGVDEQYVKSKEAEIRRHLLDFKDPTLGWFFLDQAASMKELGFDVRHEIIEREDVIRGYIGEKMEAENFFALTRVAARMKLISMRLGLEPASHEQQIRRCVEDPIGWGDYKDFSHQLWAMKTLDFDVQPEIAAHGTRMIQQVKTLERSREWNDYLPLVRYLYLLGLLPPKEKDERQPDMPPLKMYGGGG